MEEQTFPIIEEEGNPGIQIEFASEASIHNCLSLVSLATVGPPDVPTLSRGKKKVLNLLVGGYM